MSISGPSEKIYVVIVTWNGSRWIGNCINSVLHDQTDAEIIIVDNNSTDNTVSIVENGFPQVRLIRSETNLGFGQANNVGIKMAIRNNAQYVFLLNQDTTVAPGSLRKLLDAWQNRESSYGILSPVHLDGTGTHFDKGFLQYIEDDLEGDIRSLLLGSDAVEVHSIGFVNAAAWMVKVDVFKKIGGFAPLFFHYGEDRDFVNRLRFFGLKIGVVSGSRIKHFRDDRNSVVSSWSSQRLKQYFYVGWLSRIADINRSFASGWVSGFIWIFKETALALGKVKFVPMKSAVSVFFKIIKMRKEVRAHRATVSDPDPFQFLNL